MKQKRQEKKYLSAIEAQVLGSIMLIDGDAYGLSIIDFIKEQTGRSLGLGTVYKVLRTLKSYGFVQSQDLKGTPERGDGKRPYITPRRKESIFIRNISIKWKNSKSKKLFLPNLNYSSIIKFRKVNQLKS